MSSSIFSKLSKRRFGFDDQEFLPVAIDCEAPSEEEIRVTVDEEIAKRLKKSSPSALVAFHSLWSELSDPVVERLRAGRRALLVIRLPSASWYHAFEKGVLRAIEHRVRNYEVLDREFIRFIPESVGSMSWTRKPVAERAQIVLDVLQNAPVVMILPPEEMIDPSIEAFADQILNVELKPNAFDAAIRERLGAGGHRWPVDLPSRSVEPSWFDVAVAKSSGSKDVVADIRKLVHSKKRTKSVRLEDLHGYGEAKVWGLRLIAALEEYRAGLSDWSDVDGGALLVGPSGTGKTQYASALAESAGLAFFPTSYAHWQGEKEGHLGDVMRTMRKVFSDAAAAAPSLIFIDEIDSLQRRDQRRRQDEWWRTIVNGFLECLDGTGRREGVVVLAACNDGSNLDPAVVRSGRLDRRFFIGLPGPDDLGKIISDLLPTISEAEIQPVAVSLAGSASGADAVRLAREVRQLAKSEGRDPRESDIMKLALPPDDRSDAMRRRIAVHEAGHAIAVFRQGNVPSCLSMVTEFGGKLSYERISHELRIEDLNAQLAIMLAGRAAEEVVLGSVSGGAGGPDTSDLGKATQLVAMIESRYGLGASLRLAETVDERTVESRLRVAYAGSLIDAMRDKRAIEALAAFALEKRVLGQAALSDFAKEWCL